MGFVFELCDQGSLFNMLHVPTNPRLLPKHKISIAAQLAYGLTYLHTKRKVCACVRVCVCACVRVCVCVCVCVCVLHVYICGRAAGPWPHVPPHQEAGVYIRMCV
jgi:serine/threonine protein kinase